MSATDSTAANPSQQGRRALALVGILSESFCAQLSSGVLAFTLPLYGRQLGLSVAEVGLLLALPLSVSLALKPWAGRVADWLGYRRAASVAIMFRSLLSVLLTAAAMPWHLFGLQATYGLAKAIRGPSMHALIATHGSTKQLASMFAWYETARGTAGPIGRALAGLLLTASAANFRWVFGLAAALSMLPLVVLYCARPSRQAVQETRPPRPQAPPHSAPGQSPRHWTTLLPFIGVGGLISATAHMLHGLMPVLLVEHAGLSAAQAGLLYLVSTVVMLVATPLFGWLCDHAHRQLVLMTRGLANVTSSVLYLTAPTFVGFACAKACDKLGTAAFRPAWATLMAETAATDPAKRAQRLGLMSAGDDAGSVVGPILGGFLWSTWGIAALLGTRIVLALAAELYTLLLTHSGARAGPGTGQPETPVPSESGGEVSARSR